MSEPNFEKLASVP